MTVYEDFDKDNDVFEIEYTKPFPEFLENKKTFIASEFYGAVWSAAIKGKLASLFGTGIACRVMTANKARWQKGKLKLTLEFVPDEPLTPVDELDELRTPQ